ncbi:MAG: MltA domain-containing protein [Proteobacteria bacterium]|nr:MltA domain-containing protein [Pseudomonadota bacterium]
MVRFATLVTLLFIFFSQLNPAEVRAQGFSQGKNHRLLNFSDDYTPQSLHEALSSSLQYLACIPEDREYKVCGSIVRAGDIADSLKFFEQLLQEHHSPAEFNRLVQENFQICQAESTEKAEEILVTGYFEPVYRGSLERKHPYFYPLYEQPLDLIKKDGGEGIKSCRMENGKDVPYWTRAEIEEGQLLAGRELVYLADPVEAFILHVQGSGTIRFENGTTRRIHYAAKNGREYSSIGRLLVDEGRMELEQVNLPSIIAYLKEHPEQRKRILYHNESYIFFRWGESGPRGVLDEELTPERSVALDQAYFPPGMLGYLVTEKPVTDKAGNVVSWLPMKRFVLNHDTGSAIKGPGRLDFFWGRGDYAETAAGMMKHPGRFYVLLQKK